MATLSWKRRGAIAALVLLAYPAGVWLTARPSNQRDWNPNEAVLPWAEFSGHVVRLHDVRNTTYADSDRYTPAYYDTTLDLDRLVTVWFAVAPFSSWGGAAHTFLSFGFEGTPPRYVAISVEARKERGETYHFLKGLFRRYELTYVVGDERDVIRLRTNFRHDDVYLYPVRTSRERARELFVSMLRRANVLRQRPEFYNTLTANCTNTISQHVNSLAPQRVPWSLKLLFPGYADRLAYDLGLLDTDVPFDSLRSHFRINARALRYGDDPDFSARIRERGP